METTRLLVSRLADLLRREQVALVDFLDALSAFDQDRRWEALGFTSLFDFVHRELGLSRGAAFYRSTAARLVREYGEVREALGDGRLCLMTVGELAKVVTPANAAEVVPRFFHLSRREAQAVAAELRPAEVVPAREVVTQLAAAPPPPIPHHEATPPSLTTPNLESTPQQELSVLPVGRSDGPVATSAAVPPPPRDEAVPLDANLRRLHVTVSKEFLAKLEAARDALSHARPDASIEEVLSAGLDLLLAARDRRKGAVDRPRARVEDADPDADAIPAAVRREVWKRDGGCCQWKLDSGGICASTRQVEFDHVVPQARGGPSTVENLRLLCKPHNLVAARLALGEEWMGRFCGVSLRSS